MKNSVSDGVVLKVTLAATVLAGAAALYGSHFGVHVKGGVSGDVDSLETQGVFELPKDNSDVAFGDLLYWDNTAKALTKTATSNKKVGAATELAGTAATTVKVKLIPTL